MRLLDVSMEPELDADITDLRRQQVDVSPKLHPRGPEQPTLD